LAGEEQDKGLSPFPSDEAARAQEKNRLVQEIEQGLELAASMNRTGPPDAGTKEKIGSQLEQSLKAVHELTNLLSADAVRVEPDSVETTPSTEKRDCDKISYNLESDKSSFNAFFKCIDEQEKSGDYQLAMQELASLFDHQLPPSVLLQAISKYARLQYQSGKSENAEKIWEIIFNNREDILQSLDDAKRQLKFLQSLNSSLDKKTKDRIELLNKAYLEGRHYPDISRQALELLKKVKSPDLRREIKKIVSAAWDRDEREVKAAIAGIKEQFSINQQKDQSLKALDSLRKVYPNHDAKDYDALWSWIQGSDGQKITGANSGMLDSVIMVADSLIDAGQYIQALPVLKKLQNTPKHAEYKRKIQQAGGLFCKEKRQKASVYFKDSRKQKTDSLKVTLLKRASQELDSCLVHFPNLEISAKVKQNRELIAKRIEELSQPKE
jgi:hypothetical protein